MGSISRKINQPLRLVANLDDSSKYVRAFLRDSAGAPLSPASVDLNHVGDGIYLDTTYLMPNQAQVVAKFKIYDDDQYTELNECDFESVTQEYELSEFDPALLQPVNAAVFAEVQNKDITAEVIQDDMVKGEMIKDDIQSTVVQNEELNIVIKQDEFIEGVLDD